MMDDLNYYKKKKKAQMESIRVWSKSLSMASPNGKGYKMPLHCARKLIKQVQMDLFEDLKK